MLIDTLRRIVSHQPNTIALCIDEQEYSYQTLFQRASIVAHWLNHGAIARLGIQVDRSVGNYVAIMACLLTGCAYVPLNLKLPRERLDAIEHEAQLDAVFDDKQFDFTRSVPLNQIVQYESNRPAYIMFTSGSTGVPKGVPVTFGQLDVFISMMQQYHRLASDDRVAQHADLSFDMSVYDVFMTWNSGASLYVVPERLRLAPAKFIQDKKITVWFSVPSIIGLMRQLNVLPSSSLPSLRLSLFSGEPLLMGDALAWQQAAVNSIVQNLYGPTEATVECMAYSLSVQSDIDIDIGLDEQTIMPIGHALPGNMIALMDEDGQWVVDDKPGEIMIAGSQVVTGYWHQPELTADKFVQQFHPEYGDQRWYRTGDQAYRHTETGYHYLGRLDNQVKIQGHRVELEEIEYYLRQATHCSEVAAVIVSGDHGDHLLGVVEKDEINQQAIRAKLLKLLPFYMVPEKIVVVEQLPRNMNGKLDRRTLKQGLS